MVTWKGTGAAPTAPGHPRTGGPVCASPGASAGRLLVRAGLPMGPPELAVVTSRASGDGAGNLRGGGDRPLLQLDGIAHRKHPEGLSNPRRGRFYLLAPLPLVDGLQGFQDGCQALSHALPLPERAALVGAPRGLSGRLVQPRWGRACPASAGRCRPAAALPHSPGRAPRACPIGLSNQREKPAKIAPKVEKNGGKSGRF